MLFNFVDKYLFQILSVLPYLSKNSLVKQSFSFNKLLGTKTNRTVCPKNSDIYEVLNAENVLEKQLNTPYYAFRIFRDVEPMQARLSSRPSIERTFHIQPIKGRRESPWAPL